MNKVKTMDLKGKEYAKVPERIKKFREDCPRGKIETVPTFLEDNHVMFKAYIVQDQSDEHSPSGTGHAHGENKNDKAFEKLETIAVGRALAMLGYLASGEVASSEEMKAYEEHKKQKLEEATLAAVEKLEEAKTIEELKKIWIELPPEIRDNLEDKKEEMKTKLKQS